MSEDEQDKLMQELIRHLLSLPDKPPTPTEPREKAEAA